MCMLNILHVTRISRIIFLKLTSYYIVSQLTPPKGFLWHCDLSYSTRISPRLILPRHLLPLSPHMLHSSHTVSLLFFKMAKHVPTSSPLDLLISLLSDIHKACSITGHFYYSSLLLIKKSSWATVLVCFLPKQILRPRPDAQSLFGRWSLKAEGGNQKVDREERKTSEGRVDGQVTTVGTWGSVPLEPSWGPEWSTLQNCHQLYPSLNEDCLWGR